MIRAARIGESDALSALALRSKAGWGYPPAWLEAFTAELSVDAEDLDRVFVADEGEGPVGFYSLRSLSAEQVELDHLFIEPHAQGRGLGRELMRHAIDRARAAGFTCVIIHGDPNAAEFYRRFGAVEVGQVASDLIPGRTLPVFELRLTQHVAR